MTEENVNCHVRSNISSEVPSLEGNTAEGDAYCHRRLASVYPIIKLFCL